LAHKTLPCDELPLLDPPIDLPKGKQPIFGPAVAVIVFHGMGQQVKFQTLNDVAYGNGMFLVAGDGLFNRDGSVFKSTDGVTWAQVNYNPGKNLRGVMFTNGLFLITTNGANDPTSNHKWYSSALAFGQPHDVVYRCVIDPVNGSLDVWVDGRQVLSLTRQSIGVAQSGCYPCYGLYYAGGTTCTVVAEVANIAAPSTLSLSARTLKKPAWPTV